MSEEMALFGQETFEQAEKTKGSTIRLPQGRRISFMAAGRTASTSCSRHNVVALVGPTMPPAWKIDAVNGDQIRGGGAARSPRSRAIRTSPCRWAWSRACRSG
jgi:amidase